MYFLLITVPLDRRKNYQEKKEHHHNDNFVTSSLPSASSKSFLLASRISSRWSVSRSARWWIISALWKKKKRKKILKTAGRSKNAHASLSTLKGPGLSLGPKLSQTEVPLLSLTHSWCCPPPYVFPACSHFSFLFHSWLLSWGIHGSALRRVMWFVHEISWHVELGITHSTLQIFVSTDILFPR